MSAQTLQSVDPATVPSTTYATEQRPYAEAIKIIRADIRQHLVIAREIRKNQQGTTGPTRAAYNDDLRTIGNGTGSCFADMPKEHPATPARYLYLALAFLRGRSLDTVESSRPTYREEDRWCEPFMRRTNPIVPLQLTSGLGRYLTAEQYKDITGHSDPKRGTGQIHDTSLAIWLGEGVNYGGRKQVV